MEKRQKHVYWRTICLWLVRLWNWSINQWLWRQKIHYHKVWCFCSNMDCDNEQFMANKRTCYIDSLARSRSLNSHNISPFCGIFAMLSYDRFSRVLWLLERAIKSVTIMKIVIYSPHLAAGIKIEIQNLFASETILFRSRMFFFCGPQGILILPVIYIIVVCRVGLVLNTWQWFCHINN